MAASGGVLHERRGRHARRRASPRPKHDAACAMRAREGRWAGRSLPRQADARGDDAEPPLRRPVFVAWEVDSELCRGQGETRGISAPIAGHVEAM
jgi:hypothetical protein